VRPFWGIVLRELQRLRHQKARILSGLARPLLWLFLLGSGVGAIAAGADAAAYRRFLLPGILGMVLLFGAMFGALSTVHDREFGVIRLLLIAPVRRTTLVLAKIASSCSVALVQAGVLLTLLPVLGISPEPARLALLLGAMALTGLAISALGMLLATRVDSLENFSGIVNFVLLPMLFLSGALYPVRALPGALRIGAALNPLTYGVDLMKHAAFSGPSFARAGGGLDPRFRPELHPALDAAVLAATFGAALALTTLLFDREARLTRRVAGREAVG
jgi:ABC-2 type transport system permease protein